MNKCFAFIVLIVLVSSPAHAFDQNYKKESEIPEPLLFDLVRRINSDKGELEVNTLMIQQEARDMKGVYLAPEIEYAFGKGRAIELELPFEEGKVKALKSALQLQLPSFLGDVTGTQIIHEMMTHESVHETTVLLLAGKKLTNKWSTLAMVGNKFVYGNEPSIRNSRWRELPIVNVNLFYDYADVFDLGLETNLRGIGAGFEEFLIMPQIHALLSRDFKLQAGFGASYDGYRFSPVSAFRFIKEFNH